MMKWEINLALSTVKITVVMKSSIIQSRAADTLELHYGVRSPMKSSVIRQKFDWVLRARKCHLTMKERGSYGKSSIEDRFFDVLVAKFGAENVDRQVAVEHWLIDFYIVSLNVYVQFDGVYRHGLDRPLNKICECKNSRDRVILETIHRDVEQNEWFKSRLLNLVRITDKEFNADQEVCLLKLKSTNV